MSEKAAAIVGIILGLAIGFTVLGYIPMKSNYDECGKITLCNPPTE